MNDEKSLKSGNLKFTTSTVRVRIQSDFSSSGVKAVIGGCPGPDIQQPAFSICGCRLATGLLSQRYMSLMAAGRRRDAKTTRLLLT